MGADKSVIAWACIVLLAAEGEAGAYPAARCSTGWWLPNPDVPTLLEGLPAGQPFVLLPIDWPTNFGFSPLDPPDHAALGESHLRVEVRGPLGRVMPGVLHFRETLLTWPVEHQVWWRPAEALEPATTYSMRVEVKEPVRSSGEQCPWTAFEVELELRVRAESVVERAEVTSVFIEEVATPYGYAPCGKSEAERPCRSTDSLCCPDPPLGRSFRIAASVQPFVGGHIYYLASYEVRSPHLEDNAAFPFARPFTGEYVHLTSGAHGPLIPNEECARVTITNLMDDSRLVSDWACAGPSDYRPATDDGFCDADWCAQLSTPDGVAEPAEPGASERSGGCAAGGGDLLMWLLGVAFVFRRSGAGV